jgi:hypothetical protein
LGQTAPTPRGRVGSGTRRPIARERTALRWRHI